MVLEMTETSKGVFEFRPFSKTETIKKQNPLFLTKNDFISNLFSGSLGFILLVALFCAVPWLIVPVLILWFLSSLLDGDVDETTGHEEAGS